MVGTTNAGLNLRDYLSTQGIARWVQALGIPDAPVRRQGLVTTLQFLSTRMPGLPAEMALNFLLAMDLSRSVRIAHVRRDEKLIGARSFTESPYKLFFSRPGRAMQNSGINPEGRHTTLFRAFTDFDALESWAAPAIDTWTRTAPGQKTTIAPRAGTFGVMAAGGNTQLLIPNAASKLVAEQVSMR